MHRMREFVIGLPYETGQRVVSMPSTGVVLAVAIHRDQLVVYASCPDLDPVSDRTFEVVDTEREHTHGGTFIGTVLNGSRSLHVFEMTA